MIKFLVLVLKVVYLLNKIDLESFDKIFLQFVDVDRLMKRKLLRILINMGSSISPSPSPSPGLNGKKWKSKTYFNPQATNVIGGEQYEITDKELNKKMKELIDNEMIKKIFVHKVSLYKWQSTNFIMYHAFVVIQTDKWWWSIEKNTEGITIQRSRKKKFVQDIYRGIKRASQCKLIKEHQGNGKGINAVHNWLYQSDQLNKKYNLRKNNCKHFADELFDHLTTENHWSKLQKEIELSSKV